MASGAGLFRRIDMKSFTCGDCMFYDEWGKNRGACHKDPPAVSPIQHCDGSWGEVSLRPEVGTEDACCSHFVEYPLED